MPGFLPSEVKTYQYAANIVYDELIDKYGMGKLPKNININKIRQAVEVGKKRGLTPAQTAEKVYNSAERHIKGVKKMGADDLKQSLKNLGVKQSLKKGSIKQAIKDGSLDQALKSGSLDQSLKNLNKKGGTSFTAGAKSASSPGTGFTAGAKSASSASAETAEKGAAKAISKLGKFGKITGGLALATALIYGSYEVYKRYLSAAAKACAHRSGNERKDCVDRYRSNARREQIKKLHHSLQDCQKSKDPISCKKTILIKIQKISKRVK
jgi:hypothetical protein